MDPQLLASSPPERSTESSSRMAVLRHIGFGKMGRAARRPVADTVSSEPNPVASPSSFRQRLYRLHRLPAALMGQPPGIYRTRIVFCSFSVPGRHNLRDTHPLLLIPLPQ
ncbi:hypothetical protein Cob_v002683 [Colletotrichum orbiculare MAFF 240422]|uniref:Uncharacterized protein n=1 Tax=Colletotrichum orbiculare (strain 104-T / ATCC 96160 / CBS 514.97 / LARS 414 / MAFF 240422) TaxID=1213857 RepID=A0A484G0G5_COLOR|nr:hypothetical protein Cob_v002683 [Colletotrichum orbiculare MAFF 240422]